MPDGDFQLRPATAADLPALMELFRQLDEHQRPWRVFAPRRGIEREMEVHYRDALRDPDALVMVATRGGRVVGMTVGKLQRPSSFSDDPAVELSSAAVEPDSRGMGIGRALAGEIGRFARKLGVGRVTLKTFAQNERAVELWKELGFEPRILQMTIEPEALERHATPTGAD